MPIEFIFFIEVLAGGLLAGVMYALVALGFDLIYKSSGVFNLCLLYTSPSPRDTR
jgi:branched-chain amino acid transport system permease protein